MRSFDEREKALEAEFRNKEETAFRMTVRRNRLFGLWAAKQLNIAGEAAEAYAKTVIAADLEAPGDEDVIGKVRTDLVEAGAAVSDAELRSALQKAGVEARA